jgi:hypothetical protein
MKAKIELEVFVAHLRADSNKMFREGLISYNETIIFERVLDTILARALKVPIEDGNCNTEK